MNELNTKNQSKTLYLIDGHAQIFRAYHAIRSLSSPITGEPTNATFGFVGMLLKLYREFKPDYVVLTLDVSGDQGTFRTKLYPQYKANRDAPPEDMRPQTQRIKEICQMMGIPVIGVEGVEADDCIATICTKLADHSNVNIRIVSRDKDLQQLLSDRVSMFDIHKDTLMDVADLLHEKGIAPNQVIDMLALMGDNADNIPGVKGIGPKTASKLISQYGSLDAICNHLDELKPKQRENIIEAKERLPLNIELVTLKHDVPMDFELDDALVKPLDASTLGPVFQQLGFTRHLDDLYKLANTPKPAAATQKKSKPKSSDEAGLFGGLFDQLDDTTEPTESAEGVSAYFQTANPDHYTAITTETKLDEMIETINKALADGAVLSVDTETTSVNPMLAKLCGISLAWEVEQGVYIPLLSPSPDQHLDATQVLPKLKPMLESASVPKVGQNIKYDKIVLRNAGVLLNGIVFDSMIAAYLIDSTRSSYKLDNLTLANLNYQMVPLSDLIGSGKKQITFDKVPLEQAIVYAAEDADVVLRLREKFLPELKLKGVTDLHNNLEIPLADVLAELEYNGIAIDRDELRHQRENVAKRVTELRSQIIDTAGVDFNPDSTKQLADVLFNTLGCKVLKKGKTGPSTNSVVLQKIADTEQPPGSTIAQYVLEYRQLTKLLNTYLVALDEAIHPVTQRIHASFNQTVTATGRLSSSNPNLQNIPIRSEVGRQIRKAFIAPPGHVLLGADYSQIELRLLAHLSGDANLIAAFENDMDIHAAVAAEVFGLDIEQVTSAERGAAKMVNFGIVYGITAYGLSRRLANITQQPEDVAQAKQIIKDYKARYPKIDAFLAKCIAQAQTKGYVETICKRRRPIPQITSRNGQVRALGERMAINTVVQGSAADLIKVAMVNLQRRITQENRPMKMLLQIHDELVLEIPKEHLETEAKVVIEEMANAMPLVVPLKVDANWGTNWYDAK